MKVPQCSLSGVSGWAPSLRRNYSTEERRLFRCRGCGTSIFSRDEANIHMCSIVTPPKDKLRCGLCDYKANSVRELNSHVWETHPSEGFAVAMRIERRVDEAHGSEYAGPAPQRIQMVSWCQYCHEIFPLRGHFWHLERKHQIDQRWHEACGAAFDNVQDAGRHKQACTAGFEVLQCSFCGETFEISIERFRKHLVRVHEARLKDESSDSDFMLMIEAPGFPTVYSGADWKLLKEESDRFEYRTSP